MGDVTQILAAYAAGESRSIDQLVAAVYPELRRIAHNHLRGERQGHTLSTTGIVNEAYLALVDQSMASWRDRGHFFAVASKIMRNILIDYARRRKASKRGGGAVRIEFTENLAGKESNLDQLLLIDAALSQLAEKDPRLEKIVECRFFGGMTVRETAEVLDTSQRTVERDWTRAKAYLYQALHDGFSD